MAMQRIVIDLYDHTPQSEVADLLDALRGIGVDDARFERFDGTKFYFHAAGSLQVDDWQTHDVEVPSC